MTKIYLHSVCTLLQVVNVLSEKDSSYFTLDHGECCISVSFMFIP